MTTDETTTRMQYKQVLLSDSSIDRLAQVMREEKFESFDEAIIEMGEAYWNFKQMDEESWDPELAIVNLCLAKGACSERTRPMIESRLQAMSIAYPDEAKRAEQKVPRLEDPQTI